MTPRPASETVETLRRTLQTMERDPVFDAESLAVLKRIILSRIAQLEMDTVSEPDAAIPSTPPRIAA